MTATVLAQTTTKSISAKLPPAVPDLSTSLPTDRLRYVRDFGGFAVKTPSTKVFQAKVLEWARGHHDDDLNFEGLLKTEFKSGQAVCCTLTRDTLLSLSEHGHLFWREPRIFNDELLKIKLPLRADRSFLKNGECHSGPPILVKVGDPLTSMSYLIINGNHRIFKVLNSSSNSSIYVLVFRTIDSYAKFAGGPPSKPDGKWGESCPCLTNGSRPVRF